MPTFVEKPPRRTPIISIIFLVIYLLFAAAMAILAFSYQNLPMIGDIGLDANIVRIPFFVAIAYFGIIAFSFLVKGDNWLIFSIILLFFSSLGAIGLAILGAFNAQNLFQGGIPSCINDLASCNEGDGVVLFSAILLGISIPTLILNIATFFAAMKTMGANDQ